MEYYETTSNPLFGDTVVAKKIPQNHLFVKGDNPTNSVDSRDFGPIPLGKPYYYKLVLMNNTATKG